MNTDRPDSPIARFWIEEGGPSWVQREQMYETQLAPFDVALLDALDPQPGERVLDVGCGFGTTSAAVAACGAHVHGVDISPAMVERANERAAAAGIDARFDVIDVQTGDLGGPYDAVVSRYGVMFFDDPVEAFANMAGATAPGGRLVFVCWQPIDANPWMSMPTDVVRALLDEVPSDMPPIGPMVGPNPFAFGDRAFVERMLTEAGWDSILIQPCTPTIRIGGDGGVAGAVEQGLNGSGVKALLAMTDDPTVRERAAERLAEEYAPHLVDGVVSMPSAAWLVTARR